MNNIRKPLAVVLPPITWENRKVGPTVNADILLAEITASVTGIAGSIIRKKTIFASDNRDEAA